MIEHVYFFREYYLDERKLREIIISWKAPLIENKADFGRDYERFKKQIHDKGFIVMETEDKYKGLPRGVLFGRMTTGIDETTEIVKNKIQESKFPYVEGRDWCAYCGKKV